MTDLKRSTDGGEPNGSAATTELSPANVPAAHPAPAQTAPTKPSVAGTKPQAPAPTKPVQINGGRTTAPIKHSPAKGQPTSAAKPAHKSPALAVGPTAVSRVMDCTQPRCPGTIIDDYCDVCGSPASAPAFVAAEAAGSPASPAPAVGPTAVPRVTDCTQPRCPGTIIDDYCDVCGSPASAPAFVAAEAAGSPASPAPAVGPTAVPRVTDCNQPRCPGTIIDDYCDVCGSPASAPAFVAAEAAGSPASPAPAVGPTAVPRVTDCNQPRC